MNSRQMEVIREITKLKDELYKEVAEEEENRESGRLRLIISKDITNLKNDIADELKQILGGGSNGSEY